MALLPEDPEQQKKLLLGILPLLLLFGYWYFFHGDTKEEIQGMETHYEELQQKNERAQRIAQRGSRGELERRLALYQQHMTRLERLIPNGEEVPELLSGISDRAQRTDVELALLRPDQDAPGEFYRRVTYEMGVLGTYHDVGRFLSSIGSLPRIVRPIDLELGRSAREEATQLQAVFRIETYVLPQPGDAAPEGANNDQA